MFFRQRLRPLPTLLSALSFCALGMACDAKPAAETAAAATGATAATGSAAATATAASLVTAGLDAAGNDAEKPQARPQSERLLGYLDPAARAVMVTRISQDFDPTALGTVMALPPGAVRLLESRHRVLDGLEAMTGEDLAAVSKWLGPDMMVMSPQVAVRDYVIATTSATPQELGKKFEAAGMQRTEMSDMVFWLPTRSFGFKITFIEDGLLAFIPMRELGTGMSPLTAGRDLPPSEMRTQLTDMLGQDKAIVLALHAGGPMLHLDLHGDVHASQLGLRRAAEGFDAQVVLQPAAPLDEAAKTLAAREHPEESQQVQALMKRVKFVVDREALIGEVHLSEDDFELLQ